MKKGNEHHHVCNTHIDIVWIFQILTPTQWNQTFGIRFWDIVGDHIKTFLIFKPMVIYLFQSSSLVLSYKYPPSSSSIEMLFSYLSILSLNQNLLL